MLANCDRILDSENRSKNGFVTFFFVFFSLLPWLDGVFFWSSDRPRRAPLLLQRESQNVIPLLVQSSCFF